MSDALPAQASTLFKRDERRALRMRRSLMGAGTALLVCVPLIVCGFRELMPARAALEGTAGIVLLALLFYAAFRTGFNRRFADPSLTTEQVAAAVIWLAYILYHAGPAR